MLYFPCGSAAPRLRVELVHSANAPWSSDYVRSAPQQQFCEPPLTKREPSSGLCCCASLRSSSGCFRNSDSRFSRLFLAAVNISWQTLSKQRWSIMWWRSGSRSNSRKTSFPWTLWEELDCILYDNLPLEGCSVHYGIWEEEVVRQSPVHWDDGSRFLCFFLADKKTKQKTAAASFSEVVLKAAYQISFHSPFKTLNIFPCLVLPLTSDATAQPCVLRYVSVIPTDNCVNGWQ